ncbi:hypothetical protein GIB67_030847 [Kingdonia uniflora]|uniref:Uncharacterized protein n=1 Tax=Kingdonia uniflora TaxID=39325 RepID=A0A7J7L3A7_9MAGN|nr:hypothetical protein GIB67_030847 [Kingdonia uniflora]
MSFLPSRSPLSLIIVSKSLSLRTLISAMTTEAEAPNLSESIATVNPPIDGSVTVDLTESDDLNYGFSRPEMYKLPLSGTITPCERHLFLCYKNVESWPAKIEGSKDDPFLKSFFKACFARRAEVETKGKVLVTVFEGGEGTEFEDRDILIFPDMVKYRGLTELNVSTFVEDVLVNYNQWGSGSYSSLVGSHIFVCAHSSRDKRCGVCGPILLDKLREEIGSRGLNGQIFVSPCSHIGGHKYAGNLIVFSPNLEGKITGHWYGYVTPDDVPAVLDDHIGKGIVIERLWRFVFLTNISVHFKAVQDAGFVRGQMGSSNEEKKKEDEPKPQENGVMEYSKETVLDQSKKELNVNGTNGAVEGGSCCQGANGFSCCRDEKVELNSTGKAETKPEESIGVCKKGLQRISSLFTEKWEQSDVLASVAVIGAVASVAVAYNIYRRSG